VEAGSSIAGSGSGAPSLVEVGEQRFVVRLGAPGEPMEVETRAGGRARLLPWRLDDHLAALDRHVDAGGGVVRFDHEGFARDVLARSGVPVALAGELSPLALWWAMGGPDGPPAPGDAKEGWIQAGQARARLRRWTFAERERALSASVETRPDGARELKLARYLRAMLEASVIALDPPPIEALDGAAAAGLLDAVAALNTSGEREEDRLVREGGEGGRSFASTTLRVCRALGRTPSEVWAMPAAEIDRLLALIDAADPPALAPHAPSVKAPRRATLADHPDAVVILVEDG
jgi:hypothetical protein